MRRGLWPREALLGAIAPGVYTLAESYLPPWHWAGAKFEPRPPDIVRARALLEEAGWHADADGARHNARGDVLRLELAAASGQPEAEDLLTLAVEAWRTVGIDVVLRLQPFSVFFGEGARKRKLPHLSFYAWTLDPSTIGASLWRTDRIPRADNGFTGQNFPGYRNGDVTAWLTHAETILNVDERRALLGRVQERVRADLPAIPWYFRPSVVIARRDVVGLAPTGTLTPLAWNAAKWRRGPASD